VKPPRGSRPRRISSACDGNAHHVIVFRRSLRQRAPTAERRNASELGLEGIVAKRRDKPYRSGRLPDWIKVKNPGIKLTRDEIRSWRKRVIFGGEGVRERTCPGPGAIRNIAPQARDRCTRYCPRRLYGGALRVAPHPGHGRSRAGVNNSTATVSSADACRRRRPVRA
jgi:hypothetical protein